MRIERITSLISFKCQPIKEEKVDPKESKLTDPMGTPQRFPVDPVDPKPNKLNLLA